MPYEVELTIPGVPEGPEDAQNAVGEALDAVVKTLDGDGWMLEPDLQDDLIGAWASRWGEGRTYAVNLSGTWDGGPPETWRLRADVVMQPVVTLADKIYGWLAVAACLGTGLAAGGSVFWWLSDSPVFAGSVATPVGVMSAVVALFVAVFVTPRSPPPPLPEGVAEAHEGAVREAVEALIAEGHFEPAR